MAPFTGYCTDSTTASTPAYYQIEITHADSNWNWPTGSNSVIVTPTKVHDPFESHQAYLDHLSRERDRENWWMARLPVRPRISMRSVSPKRMPMNCMSRAQAGHQKRKSYVQKIRREIG